MSGRHNKFILWLPVIALCLAIFLQSCFPSPDMGPSFPLKDKVLHLAAYGLLAVLFVRACRWTWPSRLSGLQLMLLGIGFATLYGLGDEYHQSLVAARQAEVMDVVADFAGSILGSAVYLRMPAGHSRIDKTVDIL
ncbi:VanZ family protein [uncultured Desulfosarcina sp.]|uniref:VanZ family protein n=1 Tax=uncultured Desulfosarcina sp. TaxID=218289 RepID=UPI0029C7AC6D|nr:VanZ family protein [uncultured Desulfosarcina sp.]